MIDFRVWSFQDAGNDWIIRCRRCAAGWLPTKGAGYDPYALIEHTITHQRRRTRAETLRWQLDSIEQNAALIDQDLLTAGSTGGDRRRQLLLEREHFQLWREVMEAELSKLLTDEAIAAARVPWRTPAASCCDHQWLPNKSFITRRPGRL